MHFLTLSSALTFTIAAGGCATSSPTSATSATGPAATDGGKVEVHWLGQATTKVTSTSGKVIVIDPFLTNNPKTPPQYKNLDALGKVDVILVTHGHGDHVGDVKVLAERTGATVLGPAGLIATMVDLGWVSPDKAVRFGKGGHVNPTGPEIDDHPGARGALVGNHRHRSDHQEVDDLSRRSRAASSSSSRTASSSITWATRGCSAT